MQRKTAMSSDNSPQLPPKNTPWGEWDHADHLGNGIYCITTPSHGGLYIPPSMQRHVPDPVRICLMDGPQWAEEDIEMTLVLSVLIAYLEPYQLRQQFTAALDPSEQGAGIRLFDFARSVCQQYPQYEACLYYIPEEAPATLN